MRTPQSSCHHVLAEVVDGMARITEVRLRRELSEGKLLDFRQVDSGFEVIKLVAIRKVKVRWTSILPLTPPKRGWRWCL